MTHNIFSAHSINFKVYAVVSHILNSRTMGQFFSLHSFLPFIYSLFGGLLFNKNGLYFVRYISTMCAVNYMKYIRGMWVRSELSGSLCEKDPLSQTLLLPIPPSPLFVKIVCA